MGERGYIFVDRGIFDHPFFAREKYTELQAWHWMLHAAVWKPARVRVGRKLAMLDRGQLCYSERFLAEKWMWSKSRVRRFLSRCQSEAMVILKTDRDATHITICNYNKYQLGGTTERTTAEPPTEPLADHSRTKEEELKKVINKKEDLSGAIATAPPPDSGKIFDEQFWSAYPRREGANPKAPARKAFITAVKNGNSPTAIVMGAQRYAADLMKSSKVGTPYVAQAVTWLHQRRWEDYPDVIAQPASTPKPPDPTLPSHEELLRKYGVPNADDRGRSPQGEGLRREGSAVREQDGRPGPPKSANHQAGNERVAGVGELLPAAFGFLSMGDEPHRETSLDGGDRRGDDGPDTMAGVVRH